jgi:ABC-type bacteriocin/lantibiotic exporter with double-glycine peptidase domain
MAKNTKQIPFKRVAQLLTLERSDIWLLVLLTVGYGLLNIATPVAVQTLVNLVTMGGVLQPLFVVAIILLVMLLLSGAMYLMAAYLVEVIQQRLFVRSALNIAQNAQGVELSVYDQNNPVELMNRFLDITTVQKSASTLLTIGLTALLQGVIGSIILMFYSPYFAIIVLLIFVCLSIIVLVIGKTAEETAIQESKAKFEMVAWLESIVRNVSLSKFFFAKDRILTQTDLIASQYVEKRQKHFKIILKQHISVLTLYAVMGTAMLVLGGVLVLEGEINLGQFVAAELIIFGVLSSFVLFITKLEYYYDLLAALDKLGVLDDLPQETSGDYHPYNNQYDQLKVQQLNFTYSPKKKVIDNLSFTVNRGQSLAVIGDSGDGKTTLIELIVGLRHADAGYINYDGIDIKHVDLTHLRNRIGLANHTEIIQGTIIDNIRMGRDDISIENVNTILGGLGILDDVIMLPNGVLTPITELGEPLSTTQQQRLMLARAMIGEPEIIIIDRLLDTLKQDEFSAVLSMIKTLQQKSIVIVTTRYEHIANQFDLQVQLDMPQLDGSEVKS